MPSSRQARITRTAISPRLAIRIFWSTGSYVGAVSASAATPSSRERLAGALRGDVGGGDGLDQRGPRRAARAGRAGRRRPRRGPPDSRAGAAGSDAGRHPPAARCCARSSCGQSPAASSTARSGRWPSPRARRCGELAGVEPDLKWPNDLLSGDRKLAGVLAEGVAAPDDPSRLAAVVVGIGLNVGWDQPPPEVAAGAVTLEELAGRPGRPARRCSRVLLGALAPLLRALDRRARAAARALPVVADDARPARPGDAGRP